MKESRMLCSDQWFQMGGTVDGFALKARRNRRWLNVF
jgi:hypothetical protein